METDSTRYMGNKSVHFAKSTTGVGWELINIKLLYVKLMR